MNNRPTVNFIGQPSVAGFDFNGDGQIDATVQQVQHANNMVRHKRPNEVRYLNQYTGYFSTEEGDFPVSVVANSIKEAAKILTMPGVFGDDVTEPTTIKFVKSSIGTAAPTRTIGFNTVIEPAGAIDSGAYATPAHGDVENGTDVIFTASEPFGWKFNGWYKGDTLLSTQTQATIDVYDAYTSLLEYTAKYEFAPELRNGRYMDVNRGWAVDFDFNGYGNYDGRIVINSSNVNDYYFVIVKDSLKFDETTGVGSFSILPDPTVAQVEEIAGEVTLSTSFVGINLTFNNMTLGNGLGLSQDSVMNLKWVNA